MADQIKVSPTPIQRNYNDVAIDLLNIYIQNGDYTQDEITEDKIVELYKKFYKASRDALNLE